MEAGTPDNFPRIPEAVDGIQVNCCKNLKCRNFGLPERNVSAKGGDRTAWTTEHRYTVGTRRNNKVLRCNSCNQSFPYKSNLGVSEELKRISHYLSFDNEPTCPNKNCANHSKGIISNKKSYQSFGETKSGSARYRCKVCKKTFSVGKATLKQKMPHINRSLFKKIVNKAPIQCILDELEIGPGTYYGKLEFFHKQCMAFAAHREKKLMTGAVSIPDLYLGVDRQMYTVNWVKSNSKKNIILNAIGCADNKSGYAFGMFLNYDPDYNSAEVNKETFTNGDYLAPAAFRKYARLWISKDYHDAGNINQSRRVATEKGLLIDNIRAALEDEESRDDVDTSELFTSVDMRLPDVGMQVHSEYTMYGYFLYLQRLFKHVGKVMFYLDRESGIKSACFYAFRKEIFEKKCEAFYVKANKSLTVNQKYKLMADAQYRLDELKYELRSKAGGKKIDERIELMREEMKNPVKVGNEIWVKHPIPSGSEPEKAMCYLTDQGHYDNDDIGLAQLYDKASLHSIDRFMMLLRRKISVLERPIASASNEGRKWYGYSPYNPKYIPMYLDILRVYYNYCKLGKDKQTPAMKLGLAKGKVDVEEVIRFKP